MKMFIVFAALMASFSALADQCAYNKISDAKSAKALIKGNDIIQWCQNCGEKKPSTISHVDSIDMSNPSDSFYEIKVQVDGQDKDIYIDLAYTYVRTASDVFTNIAQMVGCPSEGATTFIKTGPGVKKVAHFYDKHGKMVVVKTDLKDIRLSDYKANPTTTPTTEQRLPASTK
jgi:hypothetical protein